MTTKELFTKHPDVLVKQSVGKFKRHFNMYAHLYSIGLVGMVLLYLFFRYFGANVINALVTFVIFFVIVKNGKIKRGVGRDGEYYGEVVNHKRHGSGRFSFVGGDVVRGSWKDNKLEGKAVYRFSNGAVLDGMWKEGRLIKIDKFKDLDELPAYFN